MEAFIGTILIWAPNFAPAGWAYCAGQQMQVSQNQALFALLGTAFGGSGSTLFNLPDLRSRVPLGGGMGQGPNLSAYTRGQQGGFENVTLTVPQLPSHGHPGTGLQLTAWNTPGTQTSPAANLGLAAGVAQSSGFETVTIQTYASPSGAPVPLAANSISGSTGQNGGNQGHPNVQPFLGLGFIICLQGLWPPQP